MNCPICQADIPVQCKTLPHDHDNASGERQTHKDFDVMVSHRFAKDAALDYCDGSGAIFDRAPGAVTPT